MYALVGTEAACCLSSFAVSVMPSKTTAKRKRYSLTFKLAVVETARKSSFRDAGRKHGVDESLVRRCTVPPAATCESDDLDHGAVFLEEAEPVDQDGGGSSTIDCSDEAEGE